MYSVQLKKIVVRSDTLELNPLLEPNKKAKMTVYGVMDDNSSFVIPNENIKFVTRTIFTSGDAVVAEISDDGVLTPVNGGYVRVEASFSCEGRGYYSSVNIVVRPFFREYHRTITSKIFLAMEQFGTYAKPDDGKRDGSVIMNFEETLQFIKAFDNVSAGMPKIIYLVGWQKGGHDHGYPSMDTVNPKLKRDCDETAIDSLRWLIKEAKKYHTDVSLHINILDAYSDSPLWEEYHAKHILHEDENGDILTIRGFEKYPEQFGIKFGLCSQGKLLESGEFEKRMDTLFEMIPELLDTHTIHFDNWRADACPGLGVTKESEEEAIRKMFLIMRNKYGMDVTSEGSFHGRNEPMAGLQPMTWWDVPYHPSEMPQSLYCGGRQSRLDFDPRFGDNIQIENRLRENVASGLGMMYGMLDEFGLYALSWEFLNHFKVEAFDGQTVKYSDGVRAYIEGGQPVIMWNETAIRNGTRLLVPLLYKDEREIMLYSFRDSMYCEKLPESWNDVTAVDIYAVDKLGRHEPRLVESGHATEYSYLKFPIDTGRAFIIKPHK